MAPLTQEIEEMVHSNSFLIFDWDDTLLASHHVASRGYSLDTDDIMPRKLRAQLKRLEKAIISTLEGAIQLVGASNVVVITNADHLWVELSAQKYVPNVLKTLRKGILIISARQRYEHLFPSHPYQWKLHTFHDYLETVLDISIDLPDELITSKKRMDLSATATGSHSTGCARYAANLLEQGNNDAENQNPNIPHDEFDIPPAADSPVDDDSDRSELRTPKNTRKQLPRDFWYNVVSVGDSMAEREAAIQCCRGIDKCWTKCIKFHERPTIEQVITQLNYVIDRLEYLCKTSENIDWVLDPIAREDEQ